MALIEVGRVRVLASAGVRALRGMWAVFCWWVSCWRFSLLTSVVVWGSFMFEAWRLFAVGLVVLVVPAVGQVVWAQRWPVSFERWVAGPVRRRRWRRWVRRSWPVVARECGLSAQREGADGVVWVAPKLVDVLTDGWTLTVRVRARVGQTVADLVAAVPAVGTAAGAVSWRSVSRSPSAVDMVFLMVDPLAGGRVADPGARPDGVVAVRVGRMEYGTDLVIDFADPWHLALQGMSRSGKSSLMYALLAGLAHRRNVVVAGVDPTGILLGPWEGAPRGDLRHVGTGDLDGAARVVARVVALMDERIGWLMSEGLDKVPDPSPDVPVVVVVMEEYPGLLGAAEADDAAQGRKPAERVAPRIKAGVRRLVQEGAKVGIRVVLLAQRMDAAIIGGAERSNLGTRITLRVDNSDGVRMLHNNVGADLVAAISDAEPGRGVIEAPGVALGWFKADFLTYGQYVAHVAGTAHRVLSLVKADADLCDGGDTGSGGV